MRTAGDMHYYSGIGYQPAGEDHVILSYITLFCAQAWLPPSYGDLLNTQEVKTGTNCLHGVTNVIVFFIITVVLFIQFCLLIHKEGALGTLWAVPKHAQVQRVTQCESKMALQEEVTRSPSL